MILHGGKRRPTVISSRQLHVVELIAVHGRGAQSPHFACLNQIVERLHGFFNGCVVVKPMNDVKIKIIGAEALERAVDFPKNGLARESAGVEIHLGGHEWWRV